MNDTRLDLGVLLILAGVLLCIGAALLWPAKPKATEHAGAVIGWSPIVEQAAAEAARDPMAEAAAAERAELADAAAELKPLLDAEHKAMGAAWRAFDDAIAKALHTAALWHELDRAHCQCCAATLQHQIGPVGPERRLGLRGWREDTPTGEYRLSDINRPMMATALLES
jgi:hypothetical protein